MKQHQLTLSDGSLWYINGIPVTLLKERFGRSKHLQTMNFCHEQVNIYYPGRIHDYHDENPKSTIIEDISTVTKQPSDRVVRDAMIWSLHWPGEKHFYAIKCGGESASDSLFESDYCPVVMNNSNMEDTRIMLIKRFGNSASEVHITSDLVGELYDMCATSSQRDKGLKNEGEAMVGALLGSHRRKVMGSKKTGLRNCSLSHDELYEHLLSSMRENKFVIPYISELITRINSSLDHHFGSDRVMKNIYEIRSDSTHDIMYQKSILHYSEELGKIQFLNNLVRDLGYVEKLNEAIQMELY